jgi:dUTP pyrophosphatase
MNLSDWGLPQPSFPFGNGPNDSNETAGGEPPSFPNMWKAENFDPALFFEKTREDAIIPERQNPGDAGLDLAVPEEADPIALSPSEQRLVMTGIRAAIPQGYEGQIRPRSSFALDKRITVPNTPGTIDSGYREEIGVILYNYGENDAKIDPGDRIAQLVISPIWNGVSFEGDVDENGRGGGFGSTGT